VLSKPSEKQISWNLLKIAGLLVFAAKGLAETLDQSGLEAKRQRSSLGRLSNRTKRFQHLTLTSPSVKTSMDLRQNFQVLTDNKLGLKALSI
jgi:hypothetical protein